MARKTRKSRPDYVVRALVLSIVLCGVLALLIGIAGDNPIFRLGEMAAPPAAPSPPAPPTTTQTIQNSAGTAPRDAFGVVPRRVPSQPFGPDGKPVPPR